MSAHTLVCINHADGMVFLCFFPRRMSSFNFPFRSFTCIHTHSHTFNANFYKVHCNFNLFFVSFCVVSLMMWYLNFYPLELPINCIHTLHILHRAMCLSSKSIETIISAEVYKNKKMAFTSLKGNPSVIRFVSSAFFSFSFSFFTPFDILSVLKWFPFDCLHPVDCFLL